MNPSIQESLDKLRSLEEGWFEGEGTIPAPEGIDWLEQWLDGTAWNLHVPRIYPVPDGKVLLEWDRGSRDLSLEIDLVTHRGEWYDWDRVTEEEVEKTLDLNEENALPWIRKELSWV